jgi:hypothetical protein
MERAPFQRRERPRLLSQPGPGLAHERLVSRDLGHDLPHSRRGGSVGLDDPLEPGRPLAPPRDRLVTLLDLGEGDARGSPAVVESTVVTVLKPGPVTVG